MGHRLWILAAAFLAAAPVAYAEGDDAGEVAELRRRMAEMERRLKEMDGRTKTQDEIAQAVERYLADAPVAALVGGADGGKAGWAKGGAPFIQEGDNKINFHFRNQVRYEAFFYSDDAVGTLKSPADTLSDAAPRDRSGFELERLYLGVDGQVFCPEITFNLTLNLDSDSGSGVEKEFAWLDWKYAGEHHVRGGVDKVPFTYEEQNSSASLAFADRCLYTKGFALDSDTGVMLWGYFGSSCNPKQFLYRVMASNGEGNVPASASVFNTDAFDTYSDQLLFTAMLEWTITGKDWKWDEVDHRSCKDRGTLDASFGVAGYWENDDDVSEKSPGLALRSTGPLTRMALGAWFRARWHGFSVIAEAGVRDVDYTAGSAAPDQRDYGAEITVHYRFPNSRFGVGARYGAIWLDDDYDSLTVGNAIVPIDDVITEAGVVVNYFIEDHAHKLTADLNWIQDNSAVRSSSAGYLWDPTKGVVVEDGLMLRLQWQLNF
jgi:hypothetical protein